MEDKITLGATAILRKGEVLKAVKLIPKKQIVFEKIRFTPDKADGIKFGTTFKVDRGDLIVVDQMQVDQDKNSVSAYGQDNRLIDDTHGQAQTLKRESILQMKEEGATGEEIIGNLVNNSSTFSEKTKYSQTKYVKKKQKKYSSYIQIHKPTARLVCKLYREREPAKICNMNIDSMSQILTATNIQHGSRVVILETCSGVLLSSIVERLGLKGCIVNLHVGETPSNLFALSHLNLSDESWQMISSFPLSQVGPLMSGQPLPKDPILEDSSDEVDPETIKSLNKSEGESNVSKKVEVSLAGKRKRQDLTDSEKLALKLDRRQKRRDQQKTAYNLLAAKDMDALILASRFHPTPIFLLLLETLAPSKPFAVYHEYKEPLMELFVQLSVSGIAINLQLAETFMRQYQVLPERTHPHVMMSSGGGYLLTGIKVETQSQERNRDSM